MTLGRAPALMKVQQAGCLVSPHRAEGLERNIAEAIALGTRVLATGFSGSGDLLVGDERIASKPLRVAAGAYPHADGLWWSEPDWRGLARQMRAVRRMAARRSAVVGVRRARALLRAYGVSVAGARYAAALTEIGTEIGGADARD